MNFKLWLAVLVISVLGSSWAEPEPKPEPKPEPEPEPEAKPDPAGVRYILRSRYPAPGQQSSQNRRVFDFAQERYFDVNQVYIFRYMTQYNLN